MIRIRCRQCDRKWGLPDSQAGQAWECPGCRQLAVLPELTRPAESAVSTRTKGRSVPVAVEVADGVHDHVEMYEQPVVEPSIPPPRSTAPAAAPAAHLDPEPVVPLAGSNVAMIDSAMVLELEPVAGPAETPYEISDSDVAKAEVLAFAPSPSAPKPVATSALELSPVAEGPLPSTIKKKQRKKRKPEWESDLSWQRDVLFVLGPLFFIWSILTAISFVKPSVAWVTLALGLLIYFVGKIGVIISASQEGLLQWLACLVPLYTPYYFLTRWQQTLRPFLVASCGIIFLATGAGFKTYYGLVNPIDSALTVDSSDVNIYHMMGAPDPRIGGHVTREKGAPDFRRGGDKGPDGPLQDMLDQPDTAEARAWIEGDPKKHVLTRGTRAEALRRVSELYKMGAKRVTVVGIVIHPERKNEEEACMIIVELPDDRASRRRIFNWVAETTQMKFAEEDHGQKLVMLELG